MLFAWGYQNASNCLHAIYLVLNRSSSQVADEAIAVVSILGIVALVVLTRSWLFARVGGLVCWVAGHW